MSMDKKLTSAVYAAVEKAYDHQCDIEDVADEILEIIKAYRQRRGEPVAWPKVNGVGRVLGSEQCLEVYFDSEPTDDQLRAVHDFLTATQPAEPVSQHPDDAAVDAFAVIMKAKLKRARDEKGRGGWQDMSAAELSAMLREHVEKGDPVDVANLAMMLHQNGQGITPAKPVKRRYAQGTALGEFGIIPMCDQVDDEPVKVQHADDINVADIPAVSAEHATLNLQPSSSMQPVATAFFTEQGEVAFTGIYDRTLKALEAVKTTRRGISSGSIALYAAPQAAEPVKVPSDAEVGQILKEVLHNSRYGVHEWELWLEFASALFTRYGGGTP